MAAAFDNHKLHRNVYLYGAVTYWRVDAMGQHACKPDEHWDFIGVEAGHGMGVNQLVFPRNEVQKAVVLLSMLESAHNSGMHHKAVEIRQVLGIKDPRS